MKKSEFKSYLKEEIIEILSEESTADIDNKTKAQSELNKELEKTKELTSERLISSRLAKLIESVVKGYTSQKSRELNKSVVNEEVPFPLKTKNAKNKDFSYDYEDIAQFFLEYKNWPHPTDKLNLEVMGIIITDKFYGGDIVEAYDDLWMKSYPKEDESLNEEEMDDDEMGDDEMDKAAVKGAKKGDSVTKLANKLGENAREMKSLVKKYKDAVEPEKSELIARLKELTKIKKELESLLQ